MALIKLGFFGEVKWDFLIYFARFYRSLGLKVGILDASLTNNLKYFLPEDLNIEIIDYNEMTHFLSYFDGYDVTDFNILLVNIGFDLKGLERMIECDYHFLMTSFNRKAIEKSQVMLGELSDLKEDFIYEKIYVDYISSQIKKKYIQFILSKNNTLEVKNTYCLEAHENILKGRLTLQHQQEKKTIKLPKDYYSLYEEILLETTEFNKKTIKKAYKDSRKGR